MTRMVNVRIHGPGVPAEDLTDDPRFPISSPETQDNHDGRPSQPDGQEDDCRETATADAGRDVPKPRAGRAGSPLNRSARADADQRLLMRYHQQRDPTVRSALVTRFLPLARQLARRYEYTGEPLDDLIQVASLGLLKAIDRFDPTRGPAFSSFAVPTIIGELKRHFRDRGWSVRVPRDLQELAMKLDRVFDDLARRSGRSPTVDEIAKHLGISPERVLEARGATGAYRAISLDQPRGDDDDESVVQVFGAEDPGFALTEDAATIETLMTVLSDRERQVLQLRFTEDLTQSEIGAEIGVSQMHVSRIIRQAVSRLQQEVENAPHAQIRAHL